MKKSIKVIGLLLFVLFWKNTLAKEVQLFFIFFFGSTETKGFKIVDGYVNKTDGTYCATYSSDDIINTLSSINGTSFKIYKKGTNLVKGKEWYTYNYDNNELYYFNQNSSYKVNEILQKLNMSNDYYPVISLFAHWEGDGVDGGIDMNSSNSSSKDNQNITIFGEKTIKKGKSITLKVTYNSLEKEKITWSSSNKRIATVSSSGKVTGVSQGTVTITAKTNNGAKDTIKIRIIEDTIKKVNISFNLNGGVITKKKTDEYSSKDNTIILTKNNSNIIQSISYGKKTDKNGLLDYNDENHIFIEKNGYYIKNKEEWNTRKDGTGKIYDQDKVYKASDFCDASKKDCNIILYANWIPKKIKVKYDCNGGYDTKVRTQELTYNKTNKLIDNKCFRYGYQFKEWTTTKNGNNILTSNKINKFIDSSISTILYAKWEYNNYGNLSNCTETIDKTMDDLGSINVKRCVKSYAEYFPQGFAVTDNYIYINSRNADYSNSIKRISRLSNKSDIMTIENAGHAQIFDVEQSQKEDLIILNYFVNKIKLTKNALEKNNGVGSSKNISLDKENENSYGTAYSNFYENQTVLPNEVFAFKGNWTTPKSILKISRNNYKDDKEYENKLKEVSNTIKKNTKNSLTDNILESPKYVSPQIAIDEVYDSIAFFFAKPMDKNGTVYIYKLSSFNKGKLELKKKFTIDRAYGQGIEIYGDYFYFHYGEYLYNNKGVGTNNTRVCTEENKKKDQCNKVVITRWKWNTDSEKINGTRKVLKFYINGEPEGITINNNRLYLITVTRASKKNKNGKIVFKKGTNVPENEEKLKDIRTNKRYYRNTIDIYEITGI